MDRTNNANGSQQDRGSANQVKTSEAPATPPSRTNQNASPGVNTIGVKGSQSSGRTDNRQNATNRDDMTDSTVTAGDQSETEADRKITQQIRQAVVADPDLSMKAKNCTIVTVGGVVTLRGSVDSTSERLSIGLKADGVSGVRRVDNNLVVNK